MTLMVVPELRTFRFKHVVKYLIYFCIAVGFVVIMSVPMCADEWAALDEPMDVDSQFNLEYHLRICVWAMEQGVEEKRERCRIISEFVERYLDLGGTCRIANMTATYAPPHICEAIRARCSNSP